MAPSQQAQGSLALPPRRHRRQAPAEVSLALPRTQAQPQAQRAAACLGQRRPLSRPLERPREGCLGPSLQRRRRRRRRQVEEVCLAALRAPSRRQQAGDCLETQLQLSPARERLAVAYLEVQRRHSSSNQLAEGCLATRRAPNRLGAVSLARLLRQLPLGVDCWVKHRQSLLADSSEEPQLRRPRPQLRLRLSKSTTTTCGRGRASTTSRSRSRTRLPSSTRASSASSR